MTTEHSKSEHFYEKEILPHFSLPKGKLTWQGYSDLDFDSFLYYFSIDRSNFLLLHEDGVRSGDQLEGNAIAPHETLELLRTLDDSDAFYINNTDSPGDAPGYVSIYKIE